MLFFLSLSLLKKNRLKTQFMLLISERNILVFGLFDIEMNACSVN